ncbi:MAG: hypothetical protein FWE28_08150 [Oscillospiraceae bacterium]|nr:hypothetical protein [Oscillospiraceae bacterium]
MEKLPHQTHLLGDTLVDKSHPRIMLRGKLDSLQAQVVLTQCDLEAMGANPELLADLQDLLGFLREIARCEVLEEPLRQGKLFGLSFAEVQDLSHNSARYFSVGAMTLPTSGLGRAYALLNCLRTAVRETEVIAVAAFGAERQDLIAGLNRLSSGVHVLMCQCV